MARKKWKLAINPGMFYERPTSEKAAYDRVNELRARYADGTGRALTVTVYVDEGNGRWMTFERCDFRNGDWAVERAENTSDDTKDVQ